MSTRILIPLDGSESTHAVLYYTHSIASSRPEASVTLLHVLPEASTGETADMHPCLKPLADLLTAKGWAVDSMVRHGDPVTAITNAARELPASLIVMSTHGRSGLERIREGSVTEGDYVEYLNVSGFTFSDAGWDLPENGYPDCGDVGDIVDPSAITYQAARFCKFTNNRVKNTGTYAL